MTTTVLLSTARAVYAESITEETAESLELQQPQRQAPKSPSGTAATTQQIGSRKTSSQQGNHNTITITEETPFIAREARVEHTKDAKATTAKSQLPKSLDSTVSTATGPNATSNHFSFHNHKWMNDEKDEGITTTGSNCADLTFTLIN